MTFMKKETKDGLREQLKKDMKDKELQKKIEKYCEEHSYLCPFDEFWYEKGWLDCEKIKDKEFLKFLDNIEKEAWMLADMDEDEFWTTQTITQEQAIIQAKATTDVINGIKRRIETKKLPKKIKEPVGFPSNLTRVCAGDENGD